MMEDLDIIEITIKKKYIIEKGINGWTPEEVVKDWFLDTNINQYHRSRDPCHVGGGDKIVDITINGLPFYKIEKPNIWQKIKKLFHKK
jgi:hypothetical protein